ncbi:DUF2087 domain-containing protein [Chitinimonas taiwanensis]|uniref:DUF2087 domain-containing protein n=1 Tax=Chitinimonas taiwanensis TaxID=240412 RepID=UPI0035B2B1A7
MSRPVFPYHAPDISALARSLSTQLAKQWAEHAQPPSHVQLLNMLARAVGQQNFQQFRAQAQATPSLVLPSIAADPAAKRAAQVQLPAGDVLRLLRHFDAQGRLLRWPGKFSEQLPCLWVVCRQIPAQREMSERAINEYIKRAECFGDHVLLRRELVNYGLLTRTPDGKVYRRIEQAVPEAIQALLAAVQARGA